jgi:hypothetical protein
MANMNASEYLERLASSASRDILPYTRPLMTRDQHGDPVPAGSSVLLWNRGQRYLVTAAHVFDSFRQSPLLIGTYSTWYTLGGDFRSTDPPAGRARDEDILDYAFMPISESDASALDGCQFLRGDQILLRETPTFTPPLRSKYLAIGYPLNRFNYSWKTNATAPELGRFIGVIAQRDRFAKHKRLVESHLLLELEAKGVFGRGGTLQKPPKLVGMSGGPILSLPGVTRLGDVTPPQLVGITTEYWAEHDLFVGIRIDVVLGAMDAAA